MPCGGGEFFWISQARVNSYATQSRRPPMVIEPGVRTGKVRLCGDNPIIEEQGKSWVSFEDYAVALVDELEKPEHKMSRFTIGLRRQGSCVGVSVSRLVLV